jgi:citrate lyase subunit beta/citryl-CoA lyase
VLFSPGDRPELMRKAPRSDADTIVFDLEDAVAPGRKDEAREAVRAVVTDPAFEPDQEVCLRVNPGEAATRDLEVVLAADAGARLDALMLPKASAAVDVTAVADRARERGVDLPVLPIVESAAGVLAAPEIAAVDDTDALVFGAEDLAADLGATRTAEGTEVLHAREHVVVAASAADVDAIDTVYTDFEDEVGLAEETEFALTLGFDGKLAIHPAQVPVINDAFTPDPDRVEWAERVLAARDKANAADRGVFEVDGQMIDAPLIAQAERIVARARAAGKK